MDTAIVDVLDSLGSRHSQAALLQCAEIDRRLSLHGFPIQIYLSPNP